jgi:hypothetical protein
MNPNKTTRTELDPVSEIRKLRERAESIAEQATKLEKLLGSVKGTRQIKRVIDPARPYFVGPDAPVEVLYNAVRRAISGPNARSSKTLQELVELTGEPNRNRIGGAIVKFQVDGEKVENLGTRYRAYWWLRP